MTRDGAVPLDEAAVRGMARAASLRLDDEVVQDLLRVAPRLADFAALNRRGIDLMDEPSVTFDLPLRSRP
jgi:hypothetical protein